MSTWAIVVAAGTGNRFGGPKHLEDLHGIPLWQAAAGALRQGGAEEVVIVGEVPDGVPGGRRRQDSVANGLGAIPDDVDQVLVHDAARAAASPDLVRAVIARLGRGDVDAVVPAVPVRDTLRRVDGEESRGTIDRSCLVSVQTPQGFRAGPLREVHATQQEDATDDAEMIERAGGRVVIVPGEPTNLKVTFPDDLRILREVVR